MNTAKTIPVKAYWPDRAAPTGVQRYVHIDNVVREAVDAYLRGGDGDEAVRVLSARVGRRNAPRLLPLVNHAIERVLEQAPPVLKLVLARWARRGV